MFFLPNLFGSESCIKENELITCDECGFAYQSEDTLYDEYTGNYYCDNCRDTSIPNDLFLFYIHL